MFGKGIYFAGKTSKAWRDEYNLFKDFFVLVFQQNNYISGVLQTWFRSQRTTVTQLVAILLASCFSVRLLLEACK